MATVSPLLPDRAGVVPVAGRYRRALLRSRQMLRLGLLHRKRALQPGSLLPGQPGLGDVRAQRPTVPAWQQGVVLPAQCQAADLLRQAQHGIPLLRHRPLLRRHLLPGRGTLQCGPAGTRHCCPIGQEWCGGKCCDAAACCPDAIFGTVCADLSSDAAHCGSCGNRCITAEGQYCRNGQCVCLQNKPTCGGHCCLSTEVCDANVCKPNIPIAPCGGLQQPGGPAADTRRVNLGTMIGWYAYSWNTENIPDQIIFREQSNVQHGGAVIWDTGCTPTPQFPVPLNVGRRCGFWAGGSGGVEVEVRPNCDPDNPNYLGPTSWSWTVGCPVYPSQQACMAAP